MYVWEIEQDPRLSDVALGRERHVSLHSSNVLHVSPRSPSVEESATTALSGWFGEDLFVGGDHVNAEVGGREQESPSRS